MEGCGGSLGATSTGTRKASVLKVGAALGAGGRIRPRLQGEGGVNADLREVRGVQLRGPIPRHTEAGIPLPDADVPSMSAERQRAANQTGPSHWAEHERLKDKA